MFDRVKNICKNYTYPVLYIRKTKIKIRQLWILYSLNLLCYKFQSILIQKETNSAARYPSNIKRQHADRQYQPALLKLKKDIIYSVM